MTKELKQPKSNFLRLLEEAIEYPLEKRIAIALYLTLDWDERCCQRQIQRLDGQVPQPMLIAIQNALRDVIQEYPRLSTNQRRRWEYYALAALQNVGPLPNRDELA